MKQKSTAGIPPLVPGKNPRGKWEVKYATAISPQRMNATGRVSNPRMMRVAPTVSIVPAAISSGGRCAGAWGIGGTPNSFIVPSDRKSSPTMMRNTLNIRALHGEEFQIDMLSRSLVTCAKHGFGLESAPHPQVHTAQRPGPPRLCSGSDGRHPLSIP